MNRAFETVKMIDLTAQVDLHHRFIFVSARHAVLHVQIPQERGICKAETKREAQSYGRKFLILRLIASSEVFNSKLKNRVVEFALPTHDRCNGRHFTDLGPKLGSGLETIRRNNDQSRATLRLLTYQANHVGLKNPVTFQIEVSDGSRVRLKTNMTSAIGLRVIHLGFSLRFLLFDCHREIIRRQTQSVQPNIGPMPKSKSWDRELAIVLGTLFAVKLIFSAAAGLGDDEAYDWEWSRHLDWSFFDHPVMTGLLIRISTILYGSTEGAIRLPAVISSVGGGLFLFLLAQQFFSRSTAWWTLFLYIFIPGLSLGSFLAVPDAPMTIAWLGCVWMLGTWVVVRNGKASAIDEIPPLKFWVWFGLLLGFGFLSKYTILMVALSAALWLFHLKPRWLRQPGPWIAVVLAFVCCLPILYWNWSQGWPSFKFHLADRQTGGGGLSLNRWGQYVAAQIVLLSPVVFGFAIYAWYKSLKLWKDLRWRFMFFMATPTLLLFTVQPLYAEFKAHWPLPGFAVLLPGVAELMRYAWQKSWGRWLLSIGVVAFLQIFNLIFYTQIIYPVIPKLPQALGLQFEWQPQWDPTNDLYGWDQVARYARELQSEEEMSGRRVFFSSYRYQLTSQLAYALQDRAWRIFPTRDQYMIWQKDWHPESLLGLSSVFVVDQRYRRDPNEKGQFETCSEEKKLKTFRYGVPSHQFSLWVCRGFKGLQPDP